MIELFILAGAAGTLFAAEKGARQIKKELRKVGRDVSGKTWLNKKKRERNKRAKERAEAPGFFEMLGRRAAGIEDTSSLRGQIDQLKRQLAECRRENEVLLHRLRDLRQGLSQVQANPIHTDCVHEHCVDWRNLLEKVNGKASSAAGKRWMSGR